MKHLLLTTIAAVLVVGCGPVNIWEAVEQGNIAAVRQHLAAGVNAKGAGGGTPLHSAAWNSHKEIIELLIAAGANVNAKDELGWTPLHNAAYKGQKEIAELLILKIVDLNSRNDRGKTPLDVVI